MCIFLLFDSKTKGTTDVLRRSLLKNSYFASCRLAFEGPPLFFVEIGTVIQVIYLIYPFR